MKNDDQRWFHHISPSNFWIFTCQTVKQLVIFMWIAPSLVNNWLFTKKWGFNKIGKDGWYCKFLVFRQSRGLVIWQGWRDKQRDGWLRWSWKIMEDPSELGFFGGGISRNILTAAPKIYVSLCCFSWLVVSNSRDDSSFPVVRLVFAKLESGKFH